MDCTIFSDWLLNLDAEMARKKRKILMLVDNCPAHPEVPDLKAIELIFLPPNTTSKLQPMDQGVIRSLKAYYRLALVRQIIHSYDNEHCPPKISILDAMFMITSAWRDVKPDTVINCFKKAGIAPPSQGEAINDTDDPFAFLANSLEELHSSNPDMVPIDIRAEDFIDFDCDVQVQDSRLLTDNDILHNDEEEEIVPDNENDVTDLMCDPLPPIKPSNADIALKTF